MKRSELFYREVRSVLLLLVGVFMFLPFAMAIYSLLLISFPFALVFACLTSESLHDWKLALHDLYIKLPIVFFEDAIWDHVRDILHPMKWYDIED